MEQRHTMPAVLAPELKVLVSVDEAAMLLSLGRTMVYRLVMKGAIPSLKLGRTRRIPVAALHFDNLAEVSRLQSGRAKGGSFQP